MKHSIWRFAYNSLPLRQKLKRRGMKLETICSMWHQLDDPDMFSSSPIVCAMFGVVFSLKRNGFSSWDFFSMQHVQEEYTKAK
jgi:hypothetical protein